MTKTPYKAPIKSKCTDYFHPEYLKATFPTHAGVQSLYLTYLCLLYGIPLCSIPRWSSVVESSRAGLTLLALYFSRHFRSQQLRVQAHSTNVSHRRASPYVPFRLFSHSRYTLVSMRWVRRGPKKIITANTHWYGQKRCLGSSPRNFHWKPTHKHPHSGYVHVLNPASEIDEAFTCNSAPVCQELAAATVNTAMGVFHLRCEKLFSR